MAEVEGLFKGRYARFVGASWRYDETYVKVKGVWVYLYREVAGDMAGRTR